jgi:hypothetical protein
MQKIYLKIFIAIGLISCCEIYGMENYFFNQYVDDNGLIELRHKFGDPSADDNDSQKTISMKIPSKNSTAKCCEKKIKLEELYYVVLELEKHPTLYSQTINTKENTFKKNIKVIQEGVQTKTICVDKVQMARGLFWLMQNDYKEKQQKYEKILTDNLYREKIVKIFQFFNPKKSLNTYEDVEIYAYEKFSPIPGADDFFDKVETVIFMFKKEKVAKDTLLEQIKAVKKYNQTKKKEGFTLKNNICFDLMCMLFVDGR